MEVIGMDLLELLGVIFALAYLILAMIELRACWIAAIISSFCYLFLFFESKLYTESFLQLFFIALAIQGLRKWPGKNASPLVIRTQAMQHHAMGVVSCLCLGAAIGYLIQAFTGAEYAVADALITVFSIYTTYLVTEKILENWIYWFVIDMGAALLYVQKGLLLTACLFGVYVLLCVVGYFQWRSRLGPGKSEL